MEEDLAAQRIIAVIATTAMVTKTKPKSTPPPGTVAQTAPAASLVELITLQWQRERSDLDLSDFLLAIYFMRLGTLVGRAYDRMCERRYKISGDDMRVLLALRRGGPPYAKRPTDLFRALLVTSGAVTKKVDRLTERGLVDRMADPGHGGGFLVHLTRKGLQVVEEVVEYLARESVIAPAMSQFTQSEREAGSRFAMRVLAALEHAGLADASQEDEPAPQRGRKKAGR
ncbi:MAG TPA: MarR family transcriptional regulator [Ramlibacter sp.]|uniref:MarR family winged helix-turn-helix transcriptional regulator n=1 Tax=Ramlibacter sp. TaxID=1917967 RepID=UPI002C4D5CC7|nr:MarR family transcriptional regulator [Ramlibacter sp.]HVZ45765.1 MarR family transcriptional regulator [Ramlibacter sp.]